ncbi:MAG: MaoC family dehydratase [Burkholderiaceae bacterium]|jgi:acyl dehydratase|nr:MaoC family dehydratase [Burkholderiaceae bacterium]
MIIFDTLDDLAARAGQEILVTDWYVMTQEHIDQFANATGDHQWIHVDPQRAKSGPFGATIAHGYLTLSLLPGFFARSLDVRNKCMGINYGCNKVRFMSPVPVGSRLRMRAELLEAAPIEGGRQVTWKCTIEREGADKPACVAEPVYRYFV